MVQSKIEAEYLAIINRAGKLYVCIPVHIAEGQEQCQATRGCLGYLFLIRGIIPLPSLVTPTCQTRQDIWEFCFPRGNDCL